MVSWLRLTVGENVQATFSALDGVEGGSDGIHFEATAEGSLEPNDRPAELLRRVFARISIEIDYSSN
jgi:hypothetical protein